MRRDREFGIFSGETPQGSYQNLYGHTLVPGDSPLSRVSPRSMFSPSSSFSNRFCSFENGSPFSTPFGETKYQTPSAHHVNGLWLDSKLPDSYFKKSINNEKFVDDLGLCENLNRMHIRDEENGAHMRRFEMDPYGFGSGFVDGSSCVNGNTSYNAKDYHPYDGLNNGALGYESDRCPRRGVSSGFDNNMSTLLGLQGGYDGVISRESSLTYNLSNDLCFRSWNENQSNYQLEQRKEDNNTWTGKGIQLQNPLSSVKPYLNDSFIYSQQCGADSNGGRVVINPPNSSKLMHPGVALNGNYTFGNCSPLNERTVAMPNIGVAQSLVSLEGAGNVEAFSCEVSLIVKGKNLKQGIDEEHDPSKGHKKIFPDETAMGNTQEKSSKPHSCANHGGFTDNGQSLISYRDVQFIPSLTSMAKLQGSVYLMAKDQNGCRFLQRIFDEGTFTDVLIIYNEIIDYVVELMMDPFGNYLMQKLFEVCSEEQRIQIVFTVTKEPGQLVRICLNTYGTRVVQKLIETLKTRHQISLVTSALKPGFLELIKDLNGNHVIQRCLQCFSAEDNKFIFNAATKFSVDIATHRHGCCVLQRCIAHSIGQQRDKLITEISRNSLLLAQDPYGNYVLQYIIELKTPAAISNMLSQFKGHYAHLSMQKFSSHVVEKCLKYVGESRPVIIHEFLLMPHFEQLLQDPYANYVVQCALAVTKGHLRSLLVAAVRPHSILRTSPYCKRIFSRNLLKK